jgi:hypothetical protein
MNVAIAATRLATASTSLARALICRMKTMVVMVLPLAMSIGAENAKSRVL